MSKSFAKTLLSENKDDTDFRTVDQKLSVCDMMKDKSHNNKEYSLEAGAKGL